MIVYAFFTATLFFSLSFVLCGIVYKFGPKDAPDKDRKTQKQPVSTMGGLGFLLPVLGLPGVLLILEACFASVLYSAELSFETLAQEFTKWGLWSYAILIVGTLLIGMLDDIRGSPAKPKMLLLLLLAVLAPLTGLHLQFFYLPVFGLGELPLMPVLSILGCSLWLFVIMNAVNFMDGSNGLAMGSLAIMFGGLALLGLYLSDWSGAAAGVLSICYLLIPTIAGFLIWNLRGKLYAGDTGALTGGALFASLSLLLISAGVDMRETPYANEALRHLSVWTPATLALPFLVDVFMTLIWRVKHGRNLLRAHRDHAYQLFIRSGWGHIRTAVVWWGLSVACVIGAVSAARTGPDTAFWTFWLLLMNGISLWLWQRRAFLPRVLALEAEPQVMDF